MQTFKKTLLILSIFVHGSFFAHIQTDILFCTFDMGETSALKKVMEVLSPDTDYKILPLGQSRTVLEKDSHTIDCSDFPELKDVTQNWKRENRLSEKTIGKLQENVHAKIVVTGMASALQAQLITCFKNNNSYTIAYYDNFEPPANMPYVQPFLEHAEHVDEYIISCKVAAEGFKGLKKTQNAKLTVLGQPSLESWDEVYEKTNVDKLWNDLGLSKDKPLFLFAGGYDETYESYFKLFVSAMRACPNIQALVTYHPKRDGSLEKNAIRKAPNIRVVEKGTFTTSELSIIAKAIICHKSSVGVQALYKQKPVIYVAQKGEYSNCVIEQKCALLVETEQELIKALQSMKENATPSTNALEILGIPKNASSSITHHLQNLLKKIDARKS